MNFFNRLSGRDQNPLQADLRRITETDAIDTPPKDVIISVTQASHEEESRKEILRHLQECLAETTSAKWRRVFGVLVLLEELMARGSPAVIQEIAEGRHFDPVQRLTFLVNFEHKDDRRVQNMVRLKATNLRTAIVARIEGSEVPDAESPKGAAKSSSSPNGNASATSGTGVKYEGFGSGGAGGSPTKEEDGSPRLVNPAYPGFGSDCLPPPPSEKAKKKNSVGGLVSVGHRDDTTSESEQEDDRGARGKSTPQQQQPQKKKENQAGIGNLVSTTKKRFEDDTDSGSDSEAQKKRREQKRQQQAAAAAASAVAAAAAASPPAAAQQVDLLGGLDSPVNKPAPAATSTPAVQEDLLGGFGDPAPPAAPPAQPTQPAQADNLLDF